MGSALEVEVDGAVATITLCRPEMLNAFDPQLVQELGAAITDIRARSEIRAIVLASTGKVFSAGGDFNWITRLRHDVAERLRVLEDGGNVLKMFHDLPIPVVVALHGDAYGLGATVVVSCDAVVACRSAGLADTHVLIGLVAGDGGCALWPQTIGMLRSKRYLLWGERMGAEEAERFGLITDLVESPEDVLPAAKLLAERAAALPPLAVQGTKRALNRVQQQRFGEAFDLSLAYEEVTLVSDDLLEAVDAFRNRRPAVYQGR